MLMKHKGIPRNVLQQIGLSLLAVHEPPVRTSSTGLGAAAAVMAKVAMAIMLEKCILWSRGDSGESLK